MVAREEFGEGELGEVKSKEWLSEEEDHSLERSQCLRIRDFASHQAEGLRDSTRRCCACALSWNLEAHQDGSKSNAAPMREVLYASITLRKLHNVSRG